ncbi:MAG: ABC transporter permease [Clostridiales bacterium]|jgi:putative ABC transport system permease protein|nr:ABC transporter permease [Clostridiales bacterium]
MFLENIKMSLQNVVNNKMRSFLTALGIIIGVASIISLITIMQIATNSITTQFNDLGAGKLVVSAPGTPLKKGLTDRDLQTISQIQGVTAVSPTLSLQATAVRGNIVEENITLEGKSNIYFDQNADIVALGRPLTKIDGENKALVCVINTDLQQLLFSNDDPIGKQLQIKDITYTVVGVLDPTVAGDVMNMVSQQRGTNNSDGKAIIPYQTAMVVAGIRGITSLEVIIDDPDNSTQISNNLEVALKQAFNDKDNSYSIINMDSLIETMNTMLSMMTSLLVGIASIALLVGGIGIMNMMLVSVTERTQEIGLRKALGAKPIQIQTQFIIESIFLSLLGGILGLILGLLISFVASRAMDLDFIVSASAIILGLGFSAGVGIVFGWMPARNASRLNPIDALRSN